MMGHPIAIELATSYGLSEEELFQQAFLSFLHEKRRQVQHLIIEILARYHVETLVELESQITQGAIPEHPAWEDLIVVENLEVRLEEIDTYLRRL